MHPINEHKEDETLSGRLETHEKSHTFTHSLFVCLGPLRSSLLFRLSAILIWSASRRRMRRRRCHWCQAFLIPASKQEREEREENRVLACSESLSDRRCRRAGVSVTSNPLSLHFAHASNHDDDGLEEEAEKRDSAPTPKHGKSSRAAATDLSLLVGVNLLK